MIDGDLEAASIVHAAIEEFAQELATVAHRFLDLPGWIDTERIVVGGGFSSGRVGELAIARASILLQAQYEREISLVPIRHHPDEAGLLGNIHVVPDWMLSPHDAMLAADIGGSNIRAGIVAFDRAKDIDYKAAEVRSSDLWRHADEETTRDACVDRLCAMLTDRIEKAEKAGLTVAPIVGIGCPGRVSEEGRIETGGQNLPGDWEHEDFNLPREVNSRIPKIGPNDTIVILHNDAVVQGLSESPWMRDVARWGVLTIGTGLGNARFTNRRNRAKDAERGK